MSGLPLWIVSISHLLLVIAIAFLLLDSFAISHAKNSSPRLSYGWWLGILIFVLYVFVNPEQFSTFPETRKNHLFEDYYHHIFGNRIEISWISVLVGFLLALFFIQVILRFWPDNDRFRAFGMTITSSILPIVFLLLVVGGPVVPSLVFVSLGFAIGVFVDAALIKNWSSQRCMGED